MIFKRFFFPLLVCAVLQIGSGFFSTAVLAQNTSEVGLGVGAANYKGEVAPDYNFLKNRLAGTVFYRKDVSAPVTLRAALTGGYIRANDVDVALALHQQRRAEVTTNFLELSAALEYNFLDYYDEKRRHRWTPYFMLGAAVANYNNRVRFSGGYKPYTNTTIFAIPVGVGVKYALSNHWNLGAEFGARKTFSDGIDYQGKESTPNNVPDELPNTNPYDKDWYYYNGVSISYTFYKIRCPEDKPSRRKRFIFF
jgi:opacity protein-like surface antigen